MRKYFIAGYPPIWSFTWETNETRWTFKWDGKEFTKVKVPIFNRHQYSGYSNFKEQFRQQQKKRHSRHNTYTHKPYVGRDLNKERLGFTSNDKPTKCDIKKAYKRMSLKHHPDKGGCAEMFKAIKASYEVLMSQATN
ncbi:hypothetical protein VrSk94_33740 [Vibrio rotiferianus]